MVRRKNPVAEIRKSPRNVTLKATSLSVAAIKRITDNPGFVVLKDVCIKIACGKPAERKLRNAINLRRSNRLTPSVFKICGQEIKVKTEFGAVATADYERQKPIEQCLEATDQVELKPEVTVMSKPAVVTDVLTSNQETAVVMTIPTTPIHSFKVENIEDYTQNVEKQAAATDVDEEFGPDSDNVKEKEAPLVLAQNTDHENAEADNTSATSFANKNKERGQTEEIDVQNYPAEKLGLVNQREGVMKRSTTAAVEVCMTEMGVSANDSPLSTISPSEKKNVETEQEREVVSLDSGLSVASTSGSNSRSPSVPLRSILKATRSIGVPKVSPETARVRFSLDRNTAPSEEIKPQPVNLDRSATPSPPESRVLLQLRPKLNTTYFEINTTIVLPHRDFVPEMPGLNGAVCVRDVKRVITYGIQGRRPTPGDIESLHALMHQIARPQFLCEACDLLTFFHMDIKRMKKERSPYARAWIPAFQNVIAVTQDILLHKVGGVFNLEK